MHTRRLAQVLATTTLAFAIITGCSSGPTEDLGSNEGELRGGASPECVAAAKEIRKLADHLRDERCSPTALQMTCPGVGVISGCTQCNAIAQNGHGGVFEPLFSQCKNARCECIKTRKRYDEFVEAVRHIKTLSCPTAAEVPGFYYPTPQSICDAL